MDETPAKPDQPTAVKSPRRRWYQFTLRTLLIFVTVAGSVRQWLGALPNAGCNAQIDREVAGKVKNVGCEK